MKSLTYLRLVLALVCEISKPSDSDKKIQQTQDKVLQAEISHVISRISSLPQIQLVQKMILSLELNFLTRIQAITLALVLILFNSGCTSLVRGDGGKEVVSNIVTKNLNEDKVSRTPILKLGSKGEQVVELKNRLFVLNYLTDYDSDEKNSFSNIFNAKTEKAVKDFQENNNLKIDGIVGVKTNEALVEAGWPSNLSSRALFNRGLKQSSFIDALLDYNEAIKRDKNFAEAYYRRGMLYAYADYFAGIDRDRNKASNDFTEAIKINSDYVEAYLERGIIHNEKKDWKSAIDDWTQAILIEPDNTEAYYRRAKAKEQLKNTKDIINDYIEVIKIKLKSEQDTDLKKQVEQAIKNFQNNQVSPELMLALSRGVASTGVSDIFVREEYSSSKNEDVKLLYESTIKGLEKAIDNLRNTQEQNILALLYYYKALNQYELEKDELKKREIIQLLLDNFDTKKTFKQITFASTHYYRGILFLERGEQEEAKKEFDEAIDQLPNFTKAYYLRGIIRSKQGDEQGAISDFKKYLQEDPEMEEAKKMRDYQNSTYITLEARKVCFSQEIPKEYLETLKSSVSLDAPAYLRRGKLRFLLGDYPGAKKDFQEVIKANPNLAADAYYQQGKVAAYEFYFLTEQITEQTDDKQVLKKAKEAKENFDKAIKKDPSLSKAYFERGYLQYKIILKSSINSRNTVFNKTTDFAWIDDSQNDFKQAIKIDKSFAQAYYLMVVAERYKSRTKYEQETGERALYENKNKFKLSPTEINNLTEAIRNDIYFYSDFIGANRVTMKRAICVDLGNYKQDNTTKPVSIIPFQSKKENGYYTLALNNYRKKEYKQAIENISEAIKINPDISDYYVIRGAAYYFSDNKYYKKASNNFQASIELEPRLTPLIPLTSPLNIPETTYSSSISHFLIGRIIENQDISQKEYQIALAYLPQADWIIGGGADGSQVQNIPSSSSAKVPSRRVTVQGGRSCKCP
jgi:tetratricopeptide (TPR) repeat protein